MGKIVEIGGEKWYLGLKTIADRLGYKCAHTVRRKILHEGLLAILGHLPGGRRRGLTWHISEGLIQAWQIGRAGVSRDRVKGQRIATENERRWAKRHAAKDKQRDTRAVVGPNGNQPASKPDPLNPRGRPRLDDDDVTS